MSTLGLTSQDLSVSNLVVTGTLSTPQLTTLSFTGSVAGVIDVPTLRTIFDVFTGKEIATVEIFNVLPGTLFVTGPLNNSGATILAGTVFGYIPDYDMQNDICFAQQIYNQNAPTIETAMLSCIITITAKGDMYASIDIPADGYIPMPSADGVCDAPCNIGAGYCKNARGNGCVKCKGGNWLPANF